MKSISILCSFSYFREMCGIEEKEESEPFQDQLPSILPKAVSEASKFKLLEKAEPWDEFTFQEDGSPPPNLLYQQNMEKPTTLFTFEVMIYLNLFHIEFTSRFIINNYFIILF